MMQDRIRQREEHGWLMEVWPNQHALMTGVCSRLSQRAGQDHIHSTPAKNGAGIHIESSQIYRCCRHDGCSESNRPVFRPKEATVGETCLEVRVSRVLGFKHNGLHK